MSSFLCDCNGYLGRRNDLAAYWQILRLKETRGWQSFESMKYSGGVIGCPYLEAFKHGNLHR